MRASTLTVLALVFGLAPGAAFPQAETWKDVAIPPLTPFEPAQPGRVELPNGLVIFLQEDHELPLVRGFARIRGGSREEPADKVGLVELYGEAWRTGGTRSKTGDELDDFLEARGASVETGGGLDSTSLSFDCLKESFGEVFPIFVELLREPAFREEKLELAKNGVYTGIARRNDDPMEIAGREAAKLVYGADSPLARHPEYATAAAVTREDLVAWHARTVHPNGILLGVIGDFDAKKIEATLREALAAWPRGPAVEPAEPAIAGAQPGVYFIRKDDVTQSNIRMVHLGATKKVPDYHALEVMNELFGGGFAARLFSNVRSKKGLAYAVWGGVGTGFDRPGMFQIGMGTKSETTAAAIDALHEEIRSLKQDPIGAEELQRAKDAILNSFVFRFDSRAKVLRERMLYEFYGYPADFLDRYRAGIEKVTADEVQQAARRYVHEDRIALLVVGKPEDFDRPLDGFGPVQPIDITIPHPGQVEAAFESDDAGRALLGKVVEGFGGATVLAGVSAIGQKASAVMQTPQGELSLDMDGLLVFPETLRQVRETPMGSMTLVVTPDGSFVTTPMGTQELPASQRDAMLQELKTSPLYVARHAGAPEVAVRAAGEEPVGAVKAQVLEVSAFGGQARFWVDPESGRVLKTASTSSATGAPVEQVRLLSDFRSVEGLVLPFRQTLERDGERAGSVEVLEVRVNPPVDPKLFERPSGGGE